MSIYRLFGHFGQYNYYQIIESFVKNWSVWIIYLNL